MIIDRRAGRVMWLLAAFLGVPALTAAQEGETTEAPALPEPSPREEEEEEREEVDEPSVDATLGADGGPEGATARVDVAPVDVAPVDVAVETEAAAATDADAAEEAATDGADDAAEEPLSFSIFVDGYLHALWTAPEPFHGDHSDMLPHRAYSSLAGLNLSFLGLDVSYEHDVFGATVNLRFGSSVPQLLGATSGLPDGMQFLKQAFVSWRPITEVRIDFGQFDTPYGAEVSESWLNPTYTRGALYTVVQPYYHAGFRVSYEPSPEVALTAIAVNGWNNVLDGNDGKTFGLQGTWRLPGVTLSLGYLTGPEGTSNELWRHFVDLIARFTWSELELTINADYLAEDLGGGRYDQLWGAMLSARVQVMPLFAVAARAEVVEDPDSSFTLFTATATLELLPADEIVVRLDNRLDYTNDHHFQDTHGDPADLAFSTVLGVVAHTN